MIRRTLGMVFFATGLSLAQPVISEAVNSASWRYPGLPGSGIAQGSIFTIYGSGLGPGAPARAGALPLSASLGGVSVSVNSGGQILKALLLSTNSYQVNAILPSTAPVGTGSVTVTYNNQTSAPMAIEIVPATFGIYTFGSSGIGQAIATDTSYQVNSIIRSLHPGDYATLWGTGLGAIAASDSSAPPVGNIGGPVTVHVGDKTAPAYYAGRSASFPGLDQVAFQVPAGVQGCAVPVAVETAGTVSNVATISVSAGGQTCGDSVMGQDLVDKLASGQKVDFGYVRLESWFAKYDYYSGTVGADFADASFSEFTPQTAGMAVYGVSQGYCVSGSGGYLGFSDLSQGQLDAGTQISVLGQGSVAAPNAYGLYRSYGSSSKFLWSGLNYVVSGTGGKDVGAFSATDLTSVQTIAITGLKAGQNVSRSADLTIGWTGGDPKMQNGQVTIEVYSQNSSGNLFSTLQCTAPVAAQQFTIPAWLVSQLPASGSEQSGSITIPLGWVLVGQYNAPVAFQASGLDKGMVTDAFFSGVALYFQ